MIDGDVRREVLRGPSAYALRPYVIVMMVAVLAGIVVLIGEVVGGGTAADSVKLAMLSGLTLIVVGIAVVLIGLAVFARARTRAELASGYTSGWMAYPEVDLVDPRTGVVLRKAGEPLIDRQTFLERRREARSKARERAPHPRLSSD